MTNEQLDKMVDDLRNQYEIAPHEVILVGERKAEHKDRKFDPEKDEAKKFITDVFKFTRNSVVKADARELGQKSNRFYHLLVAQPGGETITLPNGKSVKRSNRSGKYGWYVMFEKDGVSFDEIKDEVIAGSFYIVGSPDVGKIRLNNYVLMGAWVEADAGFRFRLNQVDATGRNVPLETYRRNPETGKLEKGVAEDRLLRFFVTEGAYPTLKTMLANRIAQAERYKIIEKTTASDQGAENVVLEKPVAAAETAAEPTAPPAEI